MFVISRETFLPGPDSSMAVFEYANTTHISKLLDKARAKNGTLVEEVTVGPVQRYQIQCSINKLSMDNFETAMMLYRTMQLEGVTKIAEVAGSHVAKMTTDDVYRGILALKLIDNEVCSSNTIIYTTCGRYEIRYLAPLVACLAFILGLRAWSAFIVRGQTIAIPHNSRTWFKGARDISSRGKIGVIERVEKRASTGVHDRLVLVEDENGSFHVRIDEKKLADPSELPRSLKSIQVPVHLFAFDRSRKGPGELDASAIAVRQDTEFEEYRLPSA